MSTDVFLTAAFAVVPPVVGYAAIKITNLFMTVDKHSTLLEGMDDHVKHTRGRVDAIYDILAGRGSEKGRGPEGPTL